MDERRVHRFYSEQHMRLFAAQQEYLDRRLKPLNVMIYGFNPDRGAGRETINDLSTTIRENPIKPKIGSVYLAYRQKPGRQRIAEAFNIDLETKSPELSTTHQNTNNLEEHLDKIDLILVTGQGEYKRKSDIRTDMCRGNLTMMEELSNLLQGYQGHVHIVSNSPEILAQKLAQESTLSPYQISGCSEVDRLRALKHLKKANIEGITFALGYHNDHYIFNTELNHDSTDEKEITNLKLTELVNKEGPTIFELGLKGETKTNLSVANAVTNFIVNYHFGSNLINASTYFRNDDLYLESPTLMTDARRHNEIRPNSSYLNKLEKEDRKEFDKRKSNLREELKKFGLTKKIYTVEGDFFEIDIDFENQIPEIETLPEETINVKVLSTNIQNPNVINISNIYSGKLENEIYFDEADEYTSIVDIVKKENFYTLLKRNKNKETLYSLIIFDENNYQVLTQFESNEINSFDVVGKNLFLATDDSIRHYNLESEEFERSFQDHNKSYKKVIATNNGRPTIYGLNNNQIIKWNKKNYPLTIAHGNIKDFQIDKVNGLEQLAYSTRNNVKFQDVDYEVSSPIFSLQNGKLITINGNQLIKHSGKKITSKINEATKQVLSGIKRGIHQTENYVTIVTDDYHVLFDNNLELISYKELPNIGVINYVIYET